MVAAYLDAVAGGRSDRGWSLLYPDSRRAYDNRDQYIELAAAADWEQFNWRLSEADATYCEDGGVYCQVRLQIAGTPPDFLLEAPNWHPTDHLRTITLDEGGAELGIAWMVVYFDASGSKGVSTGGG